jgi:prepilin-type N-terminal cleavage/methylation domain-containing protein
MALNKRIKCLKADKGFTLIEMLVTLSILGFVTAGLSMTINTIFMDSHIAVSETVSMRQVQNAGFWITKDIQRAKPGTVSTSVAGRFVDLDYYTGDSSASSTHVYYVISDGQMTRYLADGSTLAVAQNITGVGSQTTLASENTTGTMEWVFNIAVTNGESDTKTGTYRVQPRIQ